MYLLIGSDKLQHKVHVHMYLSFQNDEESACADQWLDPSVLISHTAKTSNIMRHLLWGWYKNSAARKLKMRIRSHRILRGAECCCDALVSLSSRGNARASSKIYLKKMNWKMIAKDHVIHHFFPATLQHKPCRPKHSTIDCPLKSFKPWIFMPSLLISRIRFRTWTCSL